MVGGTFCCVASEKDRSSGRKIGPMMTSSRQATKIVTPVMATLLCKKRLIIERMGL